MLFLELSATIYYYEWRTNQTNLLSSLAHNSCLLCGFTEVKTLMKGKSYFRMILSF